MAHITIKNIGPIKDVSLNLNKINVFMGPQSSGKSTIAKIISYCSWYEKNAILHTKNLPNFFDELIKFHNLEESYFSDASEIQYESDICKLDFKWNKEDSQNKVEFNLKEDKVFHNRKISYIPAERNFVTLQGLGKYNDTRDNILSFMYDWFLAKKDLTETNAYPMPLAGLGNILFYYDKDTDVDKVVINPEKNIKLNHASSGLRSIIPMLIVFNYIVMNIYKTKRAKTPFEIIDFEEKLKYIVSDTKEVTEEIKERMMDLKSKIDSMNELLPSITSSHEFNKIIDIQERMANILGYYSDYLYSQVIIEEPELNLFPKTQQELIYYMLSILCKEEKNHQLILTTHSPFILFALNNCMMGGLVNNKIPREKWKNFPSFPSWINPKDVSVYEIHDGRIQCIQDSDGLIEDNYLNQAYKENSNEYLSMLDYYDDEE